MQILDKFLTKIEECESLAERAQTPDAKEKFQVLSRMWERLAVFRASDDVTIPTRELSPRPHDASIGP